VRVEDRLDVDLFLTQRNAPPHRVQRSSSTSRWASKMLASASTVVGDRVLQFADLLAGLDQALLEAGSAGADSSSL
jgi:hypothetical protein